MAIERVEAQKEMILRLEDVNKHLEDEQDCLHEGLQEAMAQIGWLCVRVVIPHTGGKGPWNQWEHLGNIEGTGSICLRCFHQKQFNYIWNVTITCTQDGTAGNIWVTSGM